MYNAENTILDGLNIKIEAWSIFAADLFCEKALKQNFTKPMCVLAGL